MITGEESWIHHFDPTTKQESMHWKSLQSPVKKKVCQAAKSMNKVMLILFLMHEEQFISILSIVIWQSFFLHYCKVLRTLKRHMNKRPDLKKILPLLHNNTNPHTVFIIREFFEEKIEVHTHPTYSSDLAPVQFLSFWSPKMVIAQYAL